jgi:hypothetical protein
LSNRPEYQDEASLRWPFFFILFNAGAARCPLNRAPDRSGFECEYAQNRALLPSTCYGLGGELAFNKFRLGDWFEQGIIEGVVELLVHEFGHDTALDHLAANITKRCVASGQAVCDGAAWEIDGRS